jgi:RNase P protein component
MAKATRRNTAKRAIRRYQITRQLYAHGYSRQVIIALLDFEQESDLAAWLEYHQSHG